MRSPEPVLPADEALRSSAIETYQRCPRQFAYRYVYRLRPREVGLGTLRRSLHDTLRDLQGRCAPTEAGVPPAEVPTLAEARALFAAHWRAAVAAEAGGRRDAARADDGAEQDAPAADGPFGPLYRRHGLRVVERAWSDLLRERGLPLPADVDAPPAASAAGRPEPGPDVTSPAAAAAAGAHPAPVPLGARLDEHILVRVGARTIEVTLDRVEGPRPDGAATRHAAARPPAAADVEAGPPSGDARPVPAPDPVRFVRHRFGRGAGAADLRALLYALAAEQERGAPAQLFQHNLTTGELEPVRLEPRRLARLRQDLVEALAGMESGAYPPRPDPIMCAACPFLLVCPA